ncbi:hypothetical protein VME0621_02619 [Vibrio mediterranei]|nr:hypothetical protein VME0621_02619 [Vibrio mediterranei]
MLLDIHTIKKPLNRTVNSLQGWWRTWTQSEWAFLRA